MENLARTTAYLAKIASRRTSLRDLLVPLLPPGSRFVWEIGCGHGHFLNAFAAAHPGRLCLGLDIVRDRIERATRKRDRARLDNLHFFLAEAGDFFGALPPDTAPELIYILFPDPWPKRRHHKNRLMQPEFLHSIATRAGQGTSLHFRTDYEPYFRETEATLLAHPDWRLAPGAPWGFEHETVFQSRAPTHFSLVAQRV